MIDAAENDQNRRYAHHHMEVGDDEHGVGQRNVDDGIAEEQAGQAAIQKRDDEADGEQHRRCQVDVTAPQGEDPVVDLDGSRNGDDQSGDSEEEPEIGAHTADVHVVRPHDKAQRANAHDGPYHHAIAEDVAAARAC